jgi:hypothetical protein
MDYCFVILLEYIKLYATDPEPVNKHISGKTKQFPSGNGAKQVRKILPSLVTILKAPVLKYISTNGKLPLKLKGKLLFLSYLHPFFFLSFILFVPLTLL